MENSVLVIIITKCKGSSSDTRLYIYEPVCFVVKHSETKLKLPRCVVISSEPCFVFAGRSGDAA